MAKHWHNICHVQHVNMSKLSSVSVQFSHAWYNSWYLVLNATAQLRLWWQCHLLRRHLVIIQTCQSLTWWWCERESQRINKVQLIPKGTWMWPKFRNSFNSWKEVKWKHQPHGDTGWKVTSWGPRMSVQNPMAIHQVLRHFKQDQSSARFSASTAIQTALLLACLFNSMVPTASRLVFLFFFWHFHCFLTIPMSLLL